VPGGHYNSFGKTLQSKIDKIRVWSAMMDLIEDLSMNVRAKLEVRPVLDPV
jgi:hypothetical protein